jgi:LysM repeat protein
MTNPKIEFIKSLFCDAKAISRDTGMSWELILAQAAQETGWGEKVLAGTHNIFNIKASGEWSGESKTFHVWEIVGGKKVWVDAPFRVYPDYGAALRDRVEFLKKNPRYAKAGLFDKGTIGTLRGEATALQEAGYATDPEYAENLETVFKGRTMQAAVKQAEEAGCDCCNGVSIIKLTDATRAPLANTKVKLTTQAKEVVVTTSESGEVGIKPPESPFELAIAVWSELLQKWFPSDKKLLISNTAQAYTVISPYVGFKAKTAPHVPPPSSPPAGATSASAGNGGSAYSIRRGDTLGGIAKAHGLSYQTLAAFNNIQPPYWIAAGTNIRIPGKVELQRRM